MRPQLQRARPRNTGRLSRLPDSGRRAPRRRLLPGSSSGSGERLREEHGRGNIVRRVERHERHRHAAREHIARRKRVDPDVEFGVLVAGVDVAGDADGPTHRDDACEPASELRMCVQQLGRVHQRCEREERHVLRLRDDVGEQPRPRFRAAGARPSEARARRGRPPCSATRRGTGSRRSAVRLAHTQPGRPGAQRLRAAGAPALPRPVGGRPRQPVLPRGRRDRPPHRQQDTVVITAARAPTAMLDDEDVAYELLPHAHTECAGDEATPRSESPRTRSRRRSCSRRAAGSCER